MTDTKPRGTSDFSARLVDNFFRRWPLFLLPIALFMGIGVLTAARATPEYTVEATLSASSNPLLEPTEIRNNTINDFESPAEGTARLINERLRTDAFVDELADRSGFTELLEIGLLERDIFREQVFAIEEGQNFLTVSATWDDPESAFLLVDSTVEGYLDYVNEIVSGDSRNAVIFLTQQLDDARQEVVAAEAAFAEFSASLPELVPGQDRPPEDTFVLDRLSSAITSASERVDTIETEIDAAELAGEQATSEAGRLLRIVDPPVLPDEPESQLLNQLLSLMMFTVLGFLVAIAALVLVTVLDRTVRSEEQLARITDTSTAVAVPRIKALRESKRAARREAKRANKREKAA